MEYREIQSIKFALMGGSAIALICSIIETAITVSINDQIDFIVKIIKLSKGELHGDYIS